MSETLLSLSVLATTPSGTLELNDRDAYRVEGTSFSEQSVTKRRSMAENPFLEGEYPVNAVRGNVTESLKVYVYGATHAEFHARIAALKEVFDQARFTVTKTIEGSAVVWSCYSSDYQMTTQREYVHARMGLLSVNLLRHPQEA